jgi:hypothetical protein
MARVRQAQKVERANEEGALWIGPAGLRPLVDRLLDPERARRPSAAEFCGGLGRAPGKAAPDLDVRAVGA